jgi:hypothetical protein
MPGDRYIQQREAIIKQYPESAFLQATGPWDRAHAVIQDSSFTCNTRFIFDAYYGTNPRTPAYMMHYGVGESKGYAVHAADLMPTYWNKDISSKTLFNFIKETMRPNITKGEADLAYVAFSVLSPTYQSYLASFAAVGHPSASGAKWSPATPNDDGDQLKNVMDVVWGKIFPEFHPNFVDPQNSKNICSFWGNMSSWVEATVGISSFDHGILQGQQMHINLEL